MPGGHGLHGVQVHARQVRYGGRTGNGVPGSSGGRASATSKAPMAVRRRAVRCAPTPSASPTSAARTRTYVPRAHRRREPDGVTVHREQVEAVHPHDARRRLDRLARARRLVERATADLHRAERRRALRARPELGRHRRRDVVPGHRRGRGPRDDLAVGVEGVVVTPSSNVPSYRLGRSPRKRSRRVARPTPTTRSPSPSGPGCPRGRPSSSRARAGRRRRRHGRWGRAACRRAGRPRAPSRARRRRGRPGPPRGPRPSRRGPARWCSRRPSGARRRRRRRAIAARSCAPRDRTLTLNRPSRCCFSTAATSASRDARIDVDQVVGLRPAPARAGPPATGRSRRGRRPADARAGPARSPRTSRRPRGVLEQGLREPRVVERELAEPCREPQRLGGRRLVLEPPGVGDEARVQADGEAAVSSPPMASMRRATTSHVDDASGRRAGSCRRRRWTDGGRSRSARGHGSRRGPDARAGRTRHSRT